MNNFSQCLEYSLGSRLSFDETVLLQMIPNAVKVIKTEMAEDKLGVDYIVYLKDGSKITIDAKTRQPNSSRYWRYGEPELCIERYSVVECKKLGWLLKDSEIHPDYILYTFDKSDSDKVYLIPFLLLKKAVYTNGIKWREKYKIFTQPNSSYGGYHSDAMFIPASVLIKAVSDEMVATVSMN